MYLFKNSTTEIIVPERPNLTWHQNSASLQTGEISPIALWSQKRKNKNGHKVPQLAVLHVFKLLYVYHPSLVPYRLKILILMFVTAALN